MKYSRNMQLRLRICNGEYRVVNWGANSMGAHPRYALIGFSCFRARVGMWGQTLAWRYGWRSLLNRRAKNFSLIGRSCTSSPREFGATEERCSIKAVALPDKSISWPYAAGDPRIVSTRSTSVRFGRPVTSLGHDGEVEGQSKSPHPDHISFKQSTRYRTPPRALSFCPTALPDFYRESHEGQSPGVAHRWHGPLLAADQVPVHCSAA